jgi:hypothetical protein
MKGHEANKENNEEKDSQTGSDVTSLTDSSSQQSPPSENNKMVYKTKFGPTGSGEMFTLCNRTILKYYKRNSVCCD